MIRIRAYNKFVPISREAVDRSCESCRIMLAGNQVLKEAIPYVWGTKRRGWLAYSIINGRFNLMLTFLWYGRCTRNEYLFEWLQSPVQLFLTCAGETLPRRWYISLWTNAINFGCPCSQLSWDVFPYPHRRDSISHWFGTFNRLCRGLQLLVACCCL